MFKTKIKGYTLIELLVVIGIIGILVAVSAPGVSQYSQRIAFTGVVDNFEDLFRESFSRARAGSFYPLIFVNTSGDIPSIEFCQHLQTTPEDITQIDQTYRMIDGTYFCEPGTYDSLSMENVFISETQYIFEDLVVGELKENFAKIGIEYFPPYGEIKIFTQEQGTAWAYPPNQNSEAMKSISITFSNGIDFETVTLRQTGLLERHKGPIEHDA